MTPKERAAMQQALTALEHLQTWPMAKEAITALREALKPTREGKYYYKDNACTADNADSPDCICWHDEALAEQAEQEPVGYMVDGEFTRYRSYAEEAGGFALYAAPVRTKDLTDDELLFELKAFDASAVRLPIGFKLFARAVIAADREKNNPLTKSNKGE